MNCKCKWFLYDYRTIAPKEHSDIKDPYWRLPKDRDYLKYCPYCGNEIDYLEIDEALRNSR